MRSLKRTQTPDFLNLKNYETQSFDSLSTGQKKVIWRSLIEMQGTFCAYCEKEIGKRNRQIEHFFPKGDSPDGVNLYKDLTFEWTNLFGGCIDSDHCGQHKDRNGLLTPKPYSPRDLIKPDKHDPESIFVFTEKGHIYVKDSVIGELATNGMETIRVFNLNVASLVDSRKDTISEFQIRLKGILELAEVIPEVDFKNKIEQLYADIDKSEYRTAVNATI